jgi:hypothetical protein
MFTTPPAPRQATLDAIEEHDAAWARWPAADDNGSSRTLARRHHYCLRHALGILRPADTLACGDALLSAPLFRTLDEGPIGTRVSREAQAPLRFAQLASLHDQANPALLDLRKQLGPAQASALSVFENAANMGDHSGRSIDDYLITELEVGQPLASRHGALSASESAGWTWMHRDFALVTDRHSSIDVHPTRPSLLADAIEASDNASAITWPNGHTDNDPRR